LRIRTNAGYETNGNYRIIGASMAYSNPDFYSNSGAFYRKSDDYMAGRGDKINFSQFEKINLMSNNGYRFSKNRILDATVIYDVASNVGYPALPMDVKSAKGLITSVSFKKEQLSELFAESETKVYFNNIIHIMDDTKRPDVVMHMDMPGLSRTGGFYSILRGSQLKHNYILNFDSYYNQSLATMTMYPNDHSEKPMFIYTWPDIRTLNSSIYIEDKYRMNARNFLQISSKMAVQHASVQNDIGFHSLQVFYPDMDQNTNRFLWNFSAKHLIYLDNFQVKYGGGYGLRAPTSSEAYGFYLFNSYDDYDYIGNPLLKSESSWEGNLSVIFSKKKHRFNIDASCFYFSNYIIGKPCCFCHSRRK
jgi:iron complex outermembrane receptor protein